MEDEFSPKIVDISEPTAEEIFINQQIAEIQRRHMEELEPYFKLATNARMRRLPKYIMIPAQGKTSFELETYRD
jgi:hypothetical protein